MRYWERIRQEVKNRKITHLCHFTPATNLESILEHGILSRAHLDVGGILYFTSREERLDNGNDAISVSISAPNHKMFYSKRRASGNPDWIVLALAPHILWTHKCVFWSTNSASREMKYKTNYADSWWRFIDMFTEVSSPCGSDRSYREENKLPDYFTTRSDAEIQVLQPIDADCILGAWVDDEKLAEWTRAQMKRLPGEERPVMVTEFNASIVTAFDAWG